MINAYRHVQHAAKWVHARLPEFITPDSSEATIAAKATELLIESGIVETWYHGVPAFVLLGSRSCLSISGRDYTPSKEKVGETNLITVDLSPMLGNIWGDCARSFFVEEGICTMEPLRPEFRDGAFAEQELHQRMLEYVTPGTLFSELFEFGNDQIRELGYENLDFLGNLGHSIETSPEKRRFIDRHCHEQLSPLFTFEPHIRKPGGQWGFKHENIYCFDSSGRALEL